MKFLIAVLALTIGTHVMAYYGQILKEGTFVTVTAGDDVEGDVEIVKKENGDRYIVLQDNFDAARGPFLYVVLHKDVIPGSYTSQNSVVISMLASYTGKQYYKIPSGLNLDDYKAVIIWCKKYDVTFGSAQLK